MDELRSMDWMTLDEDKSNRTERPMSRWKKDRKARRDRGGRKRSGHRDDLYTILEPVTLGVMSLEDLGIGTMGEVDILSASGPRGQGP
jgi:hypothetical protein